MQVVKARYAIETDVDGIAILKNIERIGRTCYKSEDLITDVSAIKFVENLIKRGHGAMLEHESITVRFFCDRGVTHEVVRHRIASYAQESTRYCNYSQDKFDGEISAVDIRGGIALDPSMKHLSGTQTSLIINEWLDAMDNAERHYNTMIGLGCSAQIARGVLPTSVKSELVITMNIREWRAFFCLRVPVTAHPQMRELTIPLLGDFNDLIPVVFADL